MALSRKFERYWDMPFNEVEGVEHAPHALGNTFYYVLGSLAKVVFRCKITGLENIRGYYKKSGVMVMGNHSSYLDPFFGYIAIRGKQWPRYMARENLFEAGGNICGWLFSSCGAFPVERESSDRTALKRAAKYLSMGEVVCVLPEGTRRGRGTAEMRLHAGAAFIARMAQVPIVPLSTINVEKIKQKGKFIRLPRIKLNYGKSILLKDFDMFPKRERLDACTWYVMREVYAGVFGIDPEQVNMQELFPLDKDYTEEFKTISIPRYTPDEALEALSDHTAEE